MNLATVTNVMWERSSEYQPEVLKQFLKLQINVHMYVGYKENVFV